MQLADHKHKLWREWQANATPAAKASYKAANRATKRSASADFERHWTSQLSSVQHSMHKGDIHPAYKCLNQLSKPKLDVGRTLRDRHSGRVLQSAEERIAEWVSYCSDLFSGSTPISSEVLAQLPPPPPPSDSPYPEPTLDEVVTAIKRLKNNKSPGVCNILPEMLKYGGEDVHLAMHRLILGIWRTEAAPQDFKQDILIPIPKKGDSSLCSNYRTIALQSIAAKAYANVLRARLSEHLGSQVLEQQSGFRPDRSCTDSLFSLRLVCESAWNKHRTLFLCMLDLTKAFDSVDRNMAWQILLSRGVPPKLVALIKDLHTGHSAIIRAELDSCPVPTDTGFKQGCVLAPDLFTLTLDTVVRQLLPELQKLGVTIVYKFDGQLMHSRNPTHEELMWILLYADDISLVCDDIDNLRKAVALMDATFLQWGLTISTKKTKVLVVGRDAEVHKSNASITIRGDVLEVVSEFKYLGSIFTSDGTLDAEIAHRIASASSAFARLRRAKVWSSKALSLSTKVQFFQSIVMSVLLYGGETWTVLDRHLGPLSVFQMNCLRHICGISRLAHVPNVEILSKCKTFSVESQLRSKRLRWYGHVCRMSDTRLPKKVLHGQVQGRGAVGRPRKIWNDVLLFDTHSLNIRRPYTDAQNRSAWKAKTVIART